jgi:hypothetical protein
MTSTPQANTSLGRLAGTVDQGVCVFRGVPYAQAPVGALRFAPPAPLAAAEPRPHPPARRSRTALQEAIVIRRGRLSVRRGRLTARGSGLEARGTQSFIEARVSTPMADLDSRSGSRAPSPEPRARSHRAPSPKP